MPMNLTTARVGADTTSMRFELQKACEGPGLPGRETVQAWLAAAVAATGEPVVGVVTLRLVDAPESAELNHRYRQRQGPTNVLSFPYAEGPAADGDEERPFGDIVICASLIPEEAAEREVSEAAHWAHLVIHGMLHLLGHDHQRNEQQQVMETLEVAAMAALGYPDPYHSDNPR